MDPQQTRARDRLAMMFGLVLCTALLAGCAQLPIPATRSAAPVAPPPVLVPLDGILAQADAVGDQAVIVPPVAARADRLRRRADALR